MEEPHVVGCVQAHAHAASAEAVPLLRPVLQPAAHHRCVRCLLAQMQEARQRAHLYAHVPDEVSWNGISCALVHYLHANRSATFGLQDIPRQVLPGKGVPAAPVGRLPAELAVGVQAPQAPGRAQTLSSHRPESHETPSMADFKTRC